VDALGRALADWRGGPRRRVKGVTLDALRDSLAERDLELLTSVAQLRYVTTAQLRRLHFDRPGGNVRATIQAAQRAVNRLHGLGLVEPCARRIGGPEGGSTPRLWRITRRGTNVLRRKWSHERVPNPTHLGHLLDTVELVVRLHEHARSDDVDLLDIQTEPECWRPIVGGQGHDVLLKPDLRVTLGVGGYELHWFVEIDRGTETTSRLASKIGLYIDAWHCQVEQQVYGVFPGVLWSVPDVRRVELVRNTCESVPGVPSGMFVVTQADGAVEALKNWQHTTARPAS
jgi:protein involved in plasmid replication-relaxation